MNLLANVSITCLAVKITVSTGIANSLILFSLVFKKMTLVDSSCHHIFSTYLVLLSKVQLSSLEKIHHQQHGLLVNVSITCSVYDKGRVKNLPSFTSLPI